MGDAEQSKRTLIQGEDRGNTVCAFSVAKELLTNNRSHEKMRIDFLSLE
jgi:hypothetical protein